MVFLPALVWFFSVLVKKFVQKSISNITYVVSSGTLNLNSINQTQYSHDSAYQCWLHEQTERHCWHPELMHVSTQQDHEMFAHEIRELQHRAEFLTSFQT